MLDPSVWEMFVCLLACIWRSVGLVCGSIDVVESVLGMIYLDVDVEVEMN